MKKLFLVFLIVLSFMVSCTESSVRNVGHEYVAVGVNNGLYIIDVSDKTHPKIVKHFTDPDGYSFFGMDVKDRYMFIIDEHGTLLVADAKDVRNPKIVSRLTVSYNGRDIFVQGDRAFVATGYDVLSAVDISDPYHPKFLWRIGGAGDNGFSHEVQVQDDYAYVAVDYKGLAIVDVESARIVGELIPKESDERFLGVKIVGNYAFITTSYGYLIVVDVSNKMDPKVLGKVHVVGRSFCSFIRGDYAFVVSKSGFTIVDVSNKENPRIVKKISTLSEAFDVYVKGNYAFVSEENGMEIIDISNVNDPKVVSRLEGFTGYFVYEM